MTLYRTVVIEGVRYRFRIPETAADVLWWEVYIWAQLGQNLSLFLELSVQWLAKFVESIQGADSVEAGLVELLKLERLEALSALCGSICTAARMPEAVCEDLRTLWDRQLGVRSDAREPLCDCPRCTGDNPDAPADACKLNGLGRQTVRIAGALSGLDDAAAVLQAPAWAMDVLGVRSSVRSAMLRSDELEREDIAHTEGVWDNADPSWRDRKH